MHKGADKREEEGRKVKEEKVFYNEAHSDDARQDHFGSKTAARIKMLMSGLKKKEGGKRITDDCIYMGSSFLLLIRNQILNLWSDRQNSLESGVLRAIL